MYKCTVKQYFTIVLILFFALNLNANIIDGKDELSRKDKKDVKREKIYQYHKEILKDREFVLESDFLQSS